MKKILIIGSPGSGKSTLSVKLSQKMNIPCVHLDKLWWKEDWVHVSREEFDVLLQTELEKDSWIMDGNFNRTLHHRLEYADTVIWMD
ncbi:MAG: AAA family ATPase, partial [Oscillospiraceae bacterium]|nr:AAA family ATPase [Oscillospiraceae bacterium]